MGRRFSVRARFLLGLVVGIAAIALANTELGAASPPTVTTHPTSVTLSPGAVLSLVASATGDPIPTVQWQRSTNGGSTWNAVAGATATTYSRTVSTTDNGHSYRAVFTNSSGSVTTSAAVVTVLSGPVVTTQPVSASYALLGDPVMLQSQAQGGPAPTVQWYTSADQGASWTELAGATSATTTFTMTAERDGTWFKARWTNSEGVAESAVAKVYVGAPPTIVGPLQPVTAMAGNLTSLSVAVTGVPAPGVVWEWRYPGSDTWYVVSGATSPTYSFTASLSLSGRSYRATISNRFGSVTTPPVVLTVLGGPYVNQQSWVIEGSPKYFLEDMPVLVGSTAGITATVYGNPLPSGRVEVSTDGGATWVEDPAAEWTAKVDSFATNYLSLKYWFTVGRGDGEKLFRTVFTNEFGTVVEGPGSLDPQFAPLITAHPQPADAEPGGVVTLSAAADASPQATVRWQRGSGSSFVDVPGATSGSYSFVAAAADNGAQFRAVFTNSRGTATTDPATVTVRSAPIVASHPSTYTANGETWPCFGGFFCPMNRTGQFAASVHANPRPTVHWERSTNSGGSWTAVTAETQTSGGPALWRAPQYVTPPTSSSDHGNLYRAVFTNELGSVTTNAATLNVTYSPVVSTPASVVTSPGEDVTFTVTVGGYPAPTLQWRRAAPNSEVFVDIPGATSNVLTVEDVTAADSGSRYLVVAQNIGHFSPTSSTAATLTVRSAPVAAPVPATRWAELGEDVTISFSGTGVPAPSAEMQISFDGWQSWINVTDAETTTVGTTTTVSIQFPAPADADGVQARGVFTSVAGLAASTPTTLRIGTAPVAQDTGLPEVVAEGEHVELTFAASGTPLPEGALEISFDDGDSWIPVADATVTSTGDTTTVGVDFDAPLDADGTRARATFTNPLGTATQEYVLRVGTPPAPAPPDVPAWVTADTSVVMSFSASGRPVPDAVFQYSPDGATWFDVPDAEVVQTGDSTTVSVGILAPQEADGWKARARFSNAVGTVYSDIATLNVIPAASMAGFASLGRW